jgi:hypothetical protein
MMKKGIFSVTGCALALGLVAVPAANAASISKIKAKESIYHRSAINHPTKLSTKGKESKKLFNSINKSIDKINTNSQVLVQKADMFYTKSNTAEKELDFYDHTLEKLNASSIQLVTMQKQLDRITKKDGTTDDVTTANDEVNEEEQNNTDEINKLDELHTSFVPAASTENDNQGQDNDNQGQDNDNQGQDNDNQGQDNGNKKHSKKILHHRLKEVKNLLGSVNKNANKINSRLQGLDQNVKTFYSNPNTDEKELDFYNSTLEKLVAYSQQLLSFQKQLDRMTEKDGTTVDLTAAYEEVSNFQKTITDEITKVNQLHTSFVPVTSGSGNQDPGTGTQNPGTGSQDPGTGSQNTGTGTGN